MIGSLFAGISGLNANTTAMSIIGDNIANVNTTSFKSNRAAFANILSQSLEGASGSEIGRGVQFIGSTALWTQGTLENTTSPTDLSINGKGFFMVADENGSTYYTRAGQFEFDKDGNLVNPDGLVVQGYTIDPTSGALGSIGDITVTSGSIPPRPTDEMSVNLNLDADAVRPAAAVGDLGSELLITAEEGVAGNITVNLVGGGAAGAETAVLSNGFMTVTIQDGVSTQAQIAAAISSNAAIASCVPDNAGNAWTLGAGNDTVDLTGGVNAETYSTTVTVYDSLGSPVPLTVNFTKTSTGSRWDWAASVPGSTGTCAASGTIGFTTNGELDPAASGVTNPVVDITGLTSGAADLAIEWDFIDNGASNGTITGYASPSDTTYGSQNGYPPGILQSTSIDEEGFVTGVYSNGLLTPLYQIVLADFLSYQGLDGMGDNLYSESLASGEALLGTPGNGRLGALSPNTLEMSNVDLATEFVKMITTQRAFQANSRVITTSDEILAELINLKR
jgi:flagellar hook protein FlgE